MNLREQISEDFDSVFLNTEEFARVCDWNGEPLRIVEDANISEKQEYEAQGVNLLRKKIYCKDSDLSPPPVITEEVRLDGDVYYVSEVNPSFGYLIITLEKRAA